MENDQIIAKTPCFFAPFTALLSVDDATNNCK